MDFPAVARQVPRLAQGAVPLDPRTARYARRGVGGMRLESVLPSWHDRCHGSRVWSLEMERVVYRKRMGDGVCGSYKDGAYRESEEYGPPRVL